MKICAFDVAFVVGTIVTYFAYLLGMDLLVCWTEDHFNSSSLAVWILDTQQIFFTSTEFSVTQAAVNGNSLLLAVHDNKSGSAVAEKSPSPITVVDLNSKTVLLNIAMDYQVASMSFNLNGTILVSVPTLNGAPLQCWDPRSGSLLLAIPAVQHELGFLPKTGFFVNTPADWILYSNNCKINIWDLQESADPVQTVSAWDLNDQWGESARHTQLHQNENGEFVLESIHEHWMRSNPHRRQIILRRLNTGAVLNQFEMINKFDNVHGFVGATNSRLALIGLQHNCIFHIVDPFTGEIIASRAFEGLPYCACSYQGVPTVFATIYEHGFAQHEPKNELSAVDMLTAEIRFNLPDAPSRSRYYQTTRVLCFIQQGLVLL